MQSGSEVEFRGHLSAARAGSVADLGWLVEWLRPKLSGFLRKSVGSGMRRYVSLSDLEQEVLVAAPDWVQRLPPEAGSDDFIALALRHAHWTIGKAARKHQNFAGESVLGGAQTPDPSESAPTSGHVTQADELARVAELVLALPPELGQVVKLRGEERTFGEIAKVLGIGEDAARKRFMRAAQLLRERHSS